MRNQNLGGADRGLSIADPSRSKIPNRAQGHGWLVPGLKPSQKFLGWFLGWLLDRCLSRSVLGQAFEQVHRSNPGTEVGGTSTILSSSGPGRIGLSKVSL